MRHIEQSPGVSVILPLGGDLDTPDVPSAAASVRDRAHSLAALRERAGGDIEIVVAARESTSSEICSDLSAAGLRTLQSESSRGERLRSAARQARFDTLLFLHWDTDINSTALDELRTTASPARPWGALRLRFADARGRRCMRWISSAANARAQFLGLPYGDQGQWALRSTYEAVGGHPPWNFLEDLELARKLRTLSKPTLLRATATTSARRYAARGKLRTVWTNGRILHRFARGEDPRDLEKIYRGPHRSHREVDASELEPKRTSIYGRSR